MPLRRHAPPWLPGLANACSAAAGMALINLSWMLGVGALAVAPLGPEAIGYGVVAALLGSVIGGCVVGAMARRPGEVSCPSSSMAVIHASLLAALLARNPDAGFGEIWTGVSMAVVLAGALLVAASKSRVSRLMQYMPRPVTAGFVAGIGALVILSQVPALLGASSRLNPAGWWLLLGQVKPAALAVGIGAAAAAWSYPRTGLPGHPLLVGIAVGSVLHLVLAQMLPRESLGPTLATMNLLATAEGAVRSTWSVRGWSGMVDTLVLVLPFAAMLAFQALMNAAVTASSVASFTGGKAEIDRTLRAQGVANILAGAVGALPVTTHAPLSVLAARNGATAGVGLASVALVLVGAFAVAPLLAHIPLAALAGVLVLSGVAMVDPWTRMIARRARASRNRSVAAELLVVVGVAAAFCVGSVPLALATGLLLVLGVQAVRLCSASQVHLEAIPAPRRGHTVCVQAQGVLFFANAEKLAATVSQAVAAATVVVLDLRGVLLIDATAAMALQRAIARAGAGRVVLAAVGRGAVAQELAMAGLQASEASPWFESREHALAWAGCRSILPQVLGEASNDEAPAGSTRLA